MTAFEQIKEHITNKKSFVLEAGAGSGKTYTLIQTLNYVLEQFGRDLKFNGRKVICITYTNVAKNEIIERLEHNPLVGVSTIHEFLWDSIKPYQKQLKAELAKLNEIRYNEELAKIPELTGAKLVSFEHKYIPKLADRIGNINRVEYEDTAFRNFEEGLLHHDDIITMSKMMFESNKILTQILSEKYPFIFIDEYQDTAEETISALIDFLLERNKLKVVLGFYGDSYQRIYDAGVGSLDKYIASNQLELVKKEENYRSSKNVVNLLNKFRTNIEQIPIRASEGAVQLVICKNYPRRGTEINSKGKVVEEKITEYEKRLEPFKNDNYEKLLIKLTEKGWKFRGKSADKILVIANSRVAKRAKFGNLYAAFSIRYGQSAKQYLIDREHPLIRFFLGYVDKKNSQEREVGLEHLMSFWESKSYNEVYRFLKRYSGFFENKHLEHRHKILISETTLKLIELRQKETVKEIFDFVIDRKLLSIPEGLRKYLEKINSDLSTIQDNEVKERIIRDKDLFENVMALSYAEMTNLFSHIQNNTVFSTKHGTKGEEYRNVLTVIDDTEWKAEYNFERFFDNSDEKEDRKLRTRNLFYVECSRAKENLVVLTLSDMNIAAINKLKNWFGDDNVIDIETI